MITNKTNDVQPNQNFNPVNYPDVRFELQKMSDELVLIHGVHKADIVISYFKDRCIKTDYLTDNGAIVDKIRSGDLNSYHTESLFNASRGQTGFIQEFEDYIKAVFSKADQPDNTTPDEKWHLQVKKLKLRFPFLHDEDFTFDYGKKDVMLDKLQHRLGKTREQLNEYLLTLIH